MSESPRAPIVSAEQMRVRLAALGAGGRPVRTPASKPVSELRTWCRERVALLDYFSVERLASTARASHARHGPVEAELNAFAAADCEPVVTRDGPAWRLRHGVRRATLASLGVPGALGLLSRADAVPPEQDDIAHPMARGLLQGDLDLRHLSPVQLSGVLRAVLWLRGLPLDLPSESEILAALDLANVLAPLRAVAREDFVGRVDELAALEAFLTGSDADQPPALALHGPGGMGKSTLLAKFVLDHLRDREGSLLFSYLNLDRGELDVQFPLTLVSEACRQVSLQAPELVEPLANLRADIDEVLGAQMALRNEATHHRGRAVKDVDRHRADEALLAAQVARVIRGSSGDRPLLILLDTFERAQRKRRSFLTHLYVSLDRMRSNLPSLRVVIAGRAPAESFEVRNRPLKGLDLPQATALLRRALAGRGFEEDLLELVASRVSGNPLSLRLAADLMQREGPSALASRRGRRRLLYKLRDEQVQGVLYRRILDHVDARIRPLANPGLVLRRITREVILEVLAEPCGLTHLDSEGAQTLLDLLSREVSLVSEVTPGVLVHRSDVRREMLPLLEIEDPERVAEIHRRAVHYYQGRPEVGDQIEHLYHRLMLGQSTDELDRHWDQAPGRFLEDAWEELPPEGRVYLAHRLGVEADASDLLAADQKSWVRQTARQARTLLEAGQPQQALDLLASRRTSPSDLTVAGLVVEALAAQCRWEEALQTAREAIAEADRRGLGTDYVLLSILAGRVAEDQGSSTGADTACADAHEFFADAREGARDFGLHAEAMTAGAGVLRVARRWRVSPGRTSLHPSYLDTLREALIAEAAGLSTHQRVMHPGLLRELAAELGSAVPDLLIDAAASIGVDTDGGGTGGRLHEASSDPGTPEPDLLVTSSAWGNVLAEALRKRPDDEALKESLTDYWKSEVDRPSFDYDEAREPEEGT